MTNLEFIWFSSFGFYVMGRRRGKPRWMVGLWVVVWWMKEFFVNNSHVVVVVFRHHSLRLPAASMKKARFS